MYDILIRNARVIDGTGQPPIEADLAVEGGRIAEVGRLENAQAQTVLECRGKVVSPGFIDMHSHADFSLPIQPTAESLLHQGITTAVVGQCGISPAPLIPETRGEVVNALGGFFTGVGRHMPWERWADFGSLLDFLSRQGVALNVVPLVGQGTIRAGVMGFGQGRADENQLARMCREVDRAMDQGAFGLSTGLIYPPGSFTGTEELIELARVAGRRGGFYFSHIRGEADTLLEAVAEAIRIGRETGASVQISHFKAAREENWGKSEKALELIQRAQSEGLDVTADLYPYLAGSTNLASMLPEWAHAGGPARTLERLADPPTRARMTADMTSKGFARGFAWSQVMITSAPGNRGHEGRRVADLAADAGQTPCEWLFDTLLQSRLEISMAIFGMSEENRKRELRFPTMMIGTDGMGLAVEGPMSAGKPHPRNYGAFPRVLGHYVRELGILSLPEAVHRMTGLPAAKLRLKRRGLIRPGAAADLVVFDPATVSDEADYENPHRYARGIEQVLVNGKFAVRDGRHTRERSGVVLRIASG
jgi:N-acyl-D-amino-acid deacylase